MAIITDIEDFFTKGCGRCPRFDTPDCSTKKWATGLNGLRQICRESGLTETVKWGHPCYMHAGRNIAIFGAFRDNFRLTLFNAALLKDPENILEKQGPNTRQADMIRFMDNAQVVALKPVILAYLREAMGYAEAGIKPPKADSEIEMPGDGSALPVFALREGARERTGLILAPAGAAGARIADLSDAAKQRHIHSGG